MAKLLEKFFLVRKGEYGKVAFSSALLFSTTASLLVARAARDTLLLARPEIDLLPCLYLISALSLSAFAWMYTRFAMRVSQIKLIFIFYGLYALIFLAAYFVSLRDYSIFPVIFYVLSEVLVVTASMQSWNYITEQFDTRQGKRLFGLIGAGGILSGACAGFGIRAFTLRYDLEGLLPVTALLYILAMIMILGLSRFSRPAALEQMKNKGNDDAFFSYLKGDRYLMAVAALFIFTGIGSTFCDYIFKIIVRARFNGGGNQMASFFGLFYGISNTITLIYALLFSGRLLARLGVRGASVIMPLEVLAGSVLGLFSPGVIAAGIIKFGDTAIRYTVHNAALDLALLPLGKNIRFRARTFMTGIIRPLSGGMGALMLILLGVFSGADDIRPFITVLMITSALWLMAAVPLKNGYLQTLLASLQVKRFEPEELAEVFADRMTIRVLERELFSDEPKKALYALQLLSEIVPEKNPGYCRLLLEKTRDDALLTLVLRLVEDLASPEFFDLLVARVEDFPRMRQRIFRTMSASDPDRAQVFFLKNDAGEPPGNDLIIAWLRYFADDLSDRGLQCLNDLARSGNAGERIRAARIIPEAGNAECRDILKVLLTDRDSAVRKAALEAAALSGEEIWRLRHLAPAVLDPVVGRTAARLIRQVRGAAAYLESLFTEGMPYPVRKNLYLAFRSLASPESIDFLCRRFPLEEAYLRTIIARALSRIRRDHPSLRFHRQTVFSMIDREVQGLYLLKMVLLDRVLPAACEQIVERLFLDRQEIVFRCLGLVFVQNDIFNIHVHLRSGKNHGNAMELLDATARWPGKGRLINLFDGSPAMISRIWREEYGFNGGEIAETLLRMDDRVIQGTTLHVAQKRLKGSANLLDSRYPEVAEAAALHRQRFASAAPTDAGRETEKGVEEGKMLSAIEKVMFLKGVDIFSELSGPLLLHIAGCAREVEFGDGACIFAEDSLKERTLYVILEGTVGISRSKRDIAKLNSPACFGEMALLDNKPRSATATAEGNVRCLSIGQEDLSDMISENSDIALGIIEVLSGRLRSMLDERTV